LVAVESTVLSRLRAESHLW